MGIDLCVLGVGLVGSRNIVATAADSALRTVRAAAQLADLFRTTTKVKTTQVARSRGQRCGDVELAAFLADAVVLVKLVLDLRIAHERWGSSSSPMLNVKLHHPLPADIDQPLHDAAVDTKNTRISC